MPKVTLVKKARNDVPGTDIKAGESYYWWKFRYGGKQCSRTYPKPAQLTQSNYLQTLYGIQDNIHNLPSDEDLPDGVTDIVAELEELKDECQSSFDNIPESLQSGSTGELLQERIDALQSAIDELEGMDFSDVPDEMEEPEEPARVDIETEVSKAATAAYEKALEEYEERKQEIEDYWSDKLTEAQNVSLEG